MSDRHLLNPECEAQKETIACQTDAMWKKQTSL